MVRTDDWLEEQRPRQFVTDQKNTGSNAISDRSKNIECQEISDQPDEPENKAICDGMFFYWILQDSSAIAPNHVQ